MKKPLNQRRLGKPLLKFDLKMKLTTLLLFTTLLGLQANDSYAQKTKVTLAVENATVRDIIDDIESTTKFRFIYKVKDVNLQRKLSLSVNKEHIDTVLRSLFGSTHTAYKVRGTQIILTQDENLKIPQTVSKQSQNDTKQDQVLVSGLITDESGVPMPGANIVEKGTTNGTQADFDGKFSIQLDSENATLVISYIGFATQEVALNGRTDISVILKEDAAGLDEIVVVGYATQKKSTLTGSVSTMQGKEIASIPTSNVSQNLAGRMTGVSMRPNGGAPGSDNPDIYIRGVVSTGNTSPLIVVDGIRRDNMSQIDPNVIESVTVLKDAAAVAPFGIGGANGVIVITTKKGKTGKPTISLSSSYGFQNPTYLPEMLSARDYMALQNEGYFNLNPSGTTPPNDPGLIADYNQLHLSDPYKYPDSNFTDEFAKNTGVSINNFQISGGTDVIKYNAGLGYFDQEGIFDPVGYQRYNYNMSLDIQATKTTKFGMSLYGSIEHTDGIDADENLTHLMRSFYKFVPIQTLRYPEGDKWGESSGGSPVGVLESEGYRKDEDNTLLSSVYVEQELPFIPGLKVKGVFSYDPTTNNDKLWHVPFIFYNIDLDQQPYTYTEAISLQEGAGQPYTWLQLENRRQTKFTYQGYLNYDRIFGDHSVSALFVAEARETKNDFFNARRNNFAIEIDELSLGSSDKLDYDNGGSSGTASEIGYVYRLGYTFKDKYILEASGRYDGHYSFAPGERWGYFPAFSAAWRISEESFMKEMTSVNSLKVRSSWGKSGNLPYIDGNLAAFQYLAGYDLRGNAYAFGNGSLVQGSRVSTEPNPNITWEISTKFDIGFDLTMWNGLFNMEFDFFHEDRTGMLLAPQVTVPVEYGLALSQENKGSMDNNGFEVGLGTQKMWDNGFRFSLNANLSYAENNMLEVFQSDAERDNPNRTRVGRPFGTPYGYKSLGLFSTADDTNGDGIINSTDGYNVVQFGDLHPGDVRYADLSGPDGTPDGIIDSNDQTVIGNPVYPSVTYGFNTTAEYKGFNLSLFFQGVANSDINIQTFLTSPFANNGSNTSYEYFNNRWTPDHQNASYPRATPSPYSNNTQASDFWMVDTGYVRLKTAVLGYTLPKSVSEKLNMESISLRLTGQNLFTISKLDFIDPELGYTDRENSYPITKTLSFGVDISF